MAKQIRTIKALAKLLGRSDAAVGKWLRHSEWTFGSAPWSTSDLPAMTQWARDNLRENRAASAGRSTPGELSYLSKAQLQLLLRKITKLDLENAERRGSMHDAAACEQAQVDRIHIVKNALIWQAPSAIAQAIMSRWPSVGGTVKLLQLAEVIRTGNEDAIRLMVKV